MRLMALAGVVFAGAICGCTAAERPAPVADRVVTSADVLRNAPDDRQFTLGATDTAGRVAFAPYQEAYAASRHSTYEQTAILDRD